jgi:hypothetical protein
MHRAIGPSGHPFRLSGHPPRRLSGHWAVIPGYRATASRHSARPSDHRILPGHRAIPAILPGHRAILSDCREILPGHRAIGPSIGPSGHRDILPGHWAILSSYRAPSYQTIHRDIGISGIGPRLSGHPSQPSCHRAIGPSGHPSRLYRSILPTMRG